MTSPFPEPPRRPAVTRSHQVHRFTGRLGEVLDEVSTDTVWALSQQELAESLREAYAAQARLQALTLRLVAQADLNDLASFEGAVSLPAWLRVQVRLAPGEAKRQVRLAKALEGHQVTREALAAGGFPAASAAVITEAVDALPDEVDAAMKAQAEEFLAGEAHLHDTAALRRLAAHVEEVIDPDGAEERLAEQLARAEEQAARQACFTLGHDQTTASSQGRFKLPLLSGIKLERMLQALLNPNRPDPIGFEDPETGRPYTAEERRGQAFVELIDRIGRKDLPQTGGCDPVVVVTMDLTVLEGRLGTDRLDTGHHISGALARRLAVQHGLIPVVCGGDGQVLDLGLTQRFFDKVLRLAMAIQQGFTCAVELCDRPTSQCEAAHLHPWCEGGSTDLANGALLCPRHHTLADHPDHTIEQLRPGRIRINRRC